MIPKRCVIYCRVSTERQRDAGTIESQRELLLQTARARGWTVVSVEEDEAWQGTVPAWERPGMRRVLGFIERRAADYLHVVDIDRTSRAEDPVERALIRKVLRDNGAMLATHKGTMPDETPEEKLMLDMLSSIASYERSKIKERTLRGRKDGVLRKGVRPLTQTPIGWQWDSVGKKGYIAAPAEKPAVREVFRLAALGEGMLQIERMLVRKGMKSGRTQRYRPRGTPKGTPKVAGEKYLVRRTIAVMIANPAYYCGTWAPDRKWDPDFTVTMEPLVTREEWEAANIGLRSRPHPPARPLMYDYLLRAVVYCGHCNRKMRGHTTVSNGNAYYRCGFASRPQVNCDRCEGKGSMRADELEPLVWDYVQRLIMEPGFLHAEVDRSVNADLSANESAEASARELRADLARLADERVRVQSAFRKKLYDEDELAAQLREIESERAPLLNRLELIGVRERSEGSKAARLAAVEARLRSMRVAALTLDRHEQRAIIGELIEKVVVDPVTRNVQIHVLVGDAPASDGGEDGAGSMNNGGSPPGHSSKGGRRPTSSGSYANEISPG